MTKVTSFSSINSQATTEPIVGRSGKPLNGVYQGLWMAVAFSAMLSLFQLSLPLYSMQLFDRAIPGDSIPTLVTLSLLMFGLITCSVFIDLSRSLILSTLAQRIDMKLQKTAFSSAVDGSADGLIALRDVDTLRTFISSSLASALLDVPWTFAFIIAIFVLNLLLGWFTLGASILMFSMGIVTHLATRRSRADAITANSVGFEMLDNARQMSDLTRILGIRPRLIRQLLLNRQQVLGYGRTALERQAWIEAISRGLRSAVQVLVLALAAYLVMTANLKIGAIVASSMLFARALAPVERVGSGFSAILSFYYAWHRAFALNKQNAASMAQFKLPQLSGSIIVENVCFQQRDNKIKVLININLNINPGELIALVGPEGSGKSTLARILAGAVSPSSGSIRFDGSNIKDFDTEELGCQVGYVPEFTTVIAGNISKFISRGQIHDPQQILNAAKLAGAHMMIQGLSSGYDTELSAHDYQLSGGERQRLTLARAFYGMPRLLILDNPTAFLDDGGEAIVLQALHEFKSAGCTIVIISRMSRLLNFADQLVMLENGQIKLVARTSEIQSFLGPRLAASQKS